MPDAPHRPQITLVTPPELASAPLCLVGVAAWASGNTRSITGPISSNGRAIRSGVTCVTAPLALMPTSRSTSRRTTRGWRVAAAD